MIIKKEQNEDDVRSVDNSEEMEESLSDETSGIPNNTIKIESENEIIPQLLNNSKSPDKPTPEELSKSPNIVNIVQLDDTSSPTSIDSVNDSKYCSNCDISFTYSHTFIAHKQFYCKAKSNSTNNGTSPNGSSVSVSIAAETSV